MPMGQMLELRLLRYAAQRISTMQLSIRHLESLGYECDTVERRVTRFVTKDLFGFGDILAFGHGKVVIVQTTGHTHFYDRRSKIKNSGRAKRWVNNAPNHLIVLHAWHNSQKPPTLKEQTIDSSFWLADH